VQFALDLPAVGIGGHDEPLPGRAQLADLTEQPVERFPQFRLLPSRQSDDLLVDNVRKLSVITRTASSAPALPEVGTPASYARLDD
jgi:hypothetical protein